MRLVLYWHDVAPQADSRVKPKFAETDPASYDWSAYDAVVDGIKARGWNLLLTVSGPVPLWATNGARDTLTRPSPAEFQKFVHAVGLHYGTKVDTWSIWNEPNQPQFLMPQYSVHHTPLSPGIYRKLFIAAQHGLADAGLANARVLLGETSPRGTGKVVAPLTFLRGVLCLDSKYHKTSTSCAKLTARRLRPSRLHDGPGPDLQAHAAQRRHHRRALAADHRPRPRREGRRDHLAPADLPDRVRHREHARPGARGEPAAPVRVPRDLRAHRLRQPARRRLLAVPAARRPAEGGRARRSQRYPGFETGLFTAAGKPKPSYDGFRLPLAVRRTSATKVSIWGLVRPAAGATTASIEVRSKGGSFHALTTVRTDARGYFTKSAANASGREWRLVWTGARRHHLPRDADAGLRRVACPARWRSSSGSCGTARPSPTTPDPTPSAASPTAGASSRASRAARWRR